MQKSKISNFHSLLKNPDKCPMSNKSNFGLNMRNAD